MVTVNLLAARSDLAAAAAVHSYATNNGFTYNRQSSPEAGLGARRVGPFTLEPVRARR
jgi:hypothetical protein